MGRRVTVRKPSAAQIRTLEKWLDDSLEGPQERLVQELLLHGDGVVATDIARQLSVHVNTVYADLHAFAQDGLAVVHTRRKRGRPARIGPKEVRQICQLADRPPAEQGLAYGRWSLSSLRDQLIKQRVVKRISREHLRRLIKKGACGTAKSSES